MKIILWRCPTCYLSKRAAEQPSCTRHPAPVPMAPAKAMDAMGRQR